MVWQLQLTTLHVFICKQFAHELNRYSAIPAEKSSEASQTLDFPILSLQKLFLKSIDTQVVVPAAKIVVGSVMRITS